MDKEIELPVLPAVWGYAFRPTACLRVTGEDALTFLQGQFTQELRSEAGKPVAYGLWLNQKGKVLADSFVLRESAEDLWVMSFSASADVIRKRLESYVIADDVNIEDGTAAWQGLALGGVEARLWLEAQGVILPPAGEFKSVGDGLLFRGRRGGGESWEWLFPSGMVLPSGFTAISAEVLARLRIEAAIPVVPSDIGPGELPNEGGLEVAAISYTKGCYLGQEVMARLKAMGQVRRRLVRVKADGAPPPAVPCALLSGEKRVGELRSAVSDGKGGFVGLALITRLGLDAGLLLSAEPGGRGYIHLIDLP